MVRFDKETAGGLLILEWISPARWKREIEPFMGIDSGLDGRVGFVNGRPHKLVVVPAIQPNALQLP